MLKIVSCQQHLNDIIRGMAKRLKFQDSVNHIKKCLKTEEYTIKATKNAKQPAMKSIKTTTDTSQRDNETASDITYLPPPTKSESDKKEYSVIKLRNGLTSLLISDVSNIVNIDDVLSISKESLSESDSSDSSSGDEESYESDEMPVENDATIKLAKKNAEEKLAACALCIGVGSFSDPEDIPGLAHFVEHMVFMGSKKYPAENEFDCFIKKRGGSDNASTDCEHTTFYFECHEVHMQNALDIFSQFFISPLMKRESMSREREAIESEFQMSIGSDGCRRAQILATTAQPTNPAHKFSWGNLTTLRDNVSDDKLYAAAHEFREKHYSAHRMTLAIQARLPLKILENWVIQYFSDIPDNNLPPDNFEQPHPPFQKEQFCKLYTIEPVKDITQIELTWALPPIQQLYKSKPLHYIAWVIGHEGEGSLLSYLKQKLWALDIVASCGEDGSEENSIYTLFSICLYLTNSGINNIHDVLNCVFQYLKLFQENGIEERIFNEIKLVEDTSFRFAEEISAADNVEGLAENMHYYPSTDYLTGDHIYFEYKPEVIKEYLDKLTCDMVNIMVSSKYAASKIKLDRAEPWFGTKYNISDISADWVQTWKDIQPGSLFHLPHPNQFLTKDFSILLPPSCHPVYPEKIIQDEILEVWYKQDIKFKRPLGYMCFHFISNFYYISPHNAAMLDLFIAVLKQLLAEILYPANMAQLNYAIRADERGILLAVDGYNEKLAHLLKTIIEHMAAFNKNLTPGLFNAMKDELKKSYYNSCLKTGYLNREIRMSILLHMYWNAVDKHKAITDVTYESLRSFSTECFQLLYIECLIQGNISKENAIKICYDVKETLQCKPLLPNTTPEIRVCQLPVGEKYCQVQSFADNSNCTVTSYYQSGPATITDYTTVELLLMMMEEPAFDTLRTQEQLGYDVSCNLRDTFGVLGFSITVHSQADKNSVDHVADRITNFLHSFLVKAKETSKEEFQEVQRSLIKLKMCADVDLKEEFKRNWDEIKSNEYVFDRLLKEKKCLENLTLDKVCEWLEKHICANYNLRKLCVQIVGNLKKNEDTVNRNDSDESLDSSEQRLREVYDSEKVPEDSKMGNVKSDISAQESTSSSESSAYTNDQTSNMDLRFYSAAREPHDNKYICNIQNYKKKLTVFPVLKITKC